MTTDYAFETLGWYGFEGVVSTLFRKVLGPGLSAFSGSADQGRDATFSGRAVFPGNADGWDGAWILQCKYKSIDLRNKAELVEELRRDLKKELGKVFKKYGHNCDNYLLITNLPLSASEKDSLLLTARKFRPSLRFLPVGRLDLEQLLNLNPQVARAFPSLLSIRHLRELFNRGITQRSLEYMDQIHDGLQRYVVTNAYQRAHEMLTLKHFCVLTGSPKMGKSVTADALNAAFAVDDFEIVEIRNVRDLEDVAEPDRKMVFFCDDVFGDLTLLPERRNDWINGIARRIRGLSPTRKLLWTTRNYILEEAINSSRLTEELPDFPNCDTVTVDVGSLSRLEKAEILYKHAKHSSIGSVEKEIIRKFCIKIVDHENFSPETIRQLCTRRLSKIVSAESESECWLRISKFFNEPGAEWRHAYDALDQHERLVCLLLTSLNSPVSVHELREAFERECRDTDPKRFEDVLRKLDGSFIKRSVDYLGRGRVQYYHPSIKDLVIGFLSENRCTRRRFIEMLSIDGLGTLIPSSNHSVSGEGSDRHRLKIEAENDLQSLKDVLNERLLPSLKLDEALILSHRLVDSVKSVQNRRNPLVTLVIEAFIEHVCGTEFVKSNLQGSFRRWIPFLENVERLLSISKDDRIPTSLVQLLKTPDQNATALQFLKVAIHLKRLVSPIVVEKYLTKDRKDLAQEEVQDAINGAIEAKPTERDDDYYDNCISWHETYGELQDDCVYFSSYGVDFDRIHEFEKTMEEVPTEEDIEERRSDAQYDSWTEDQHHEELADKEITDIFEDLR